MILMNMKYPVAKSWVDPRVWEREIMRVGAKWVPIFDMITMPRTGGEAGCTIRKVLWVLCCMYFATTNSVVEPKQFKMEKKGYEWIAVVLTMAEHTYT